MRVEGSQKLFFPGALEKRFQAGGTVHNFDRPMAEKVQDATNFANDFLNREVTNHYYACREFTDQLARSTASEVLTTLGENGGVVSFEGNSGVGKGTFVKKLKNILKREHGRKVHVIPLDMFMKSREWRYAFEKLISGYEMSNLDYQNLASELSEYDYYRLSESQDGYNDFWNSASEDPFSDPYVRRYLMYVFNVKEIDDLKKEIDFKSGFPFESEYWHNDKMRESFEDLYSFFHLNSSDSFTFRVENPYSQREKKFMTTPFEKEIKKGDIVILDGKYSGQFGYLCDLNYRIADSEARTSMRYVRRAVKQIASKPLDEQKEYLIRKLRSYPTLIASFNLHSHQIPDEKTRKNLNDPESIGSATTIPIRRIDISSSPYEFWTKGKLKNDYANFLPGLKAVSVPDHML